ncbi:MAG: metalloregulator ArsR/SmtB family transcription factor [Acidimicrobiia bacterium]
MDTLQIVAEPRRRDILRVIWDDELAASDIAAHFDVTFGAISQHLAVLRGAHLVSVRRDGNRRLYRADRDSLEPYRQVLETMWGQTLGDLADVIEREEASR